MGCCQNHDTSQEKKDENVNDLTDTNNKQTMSKTQKNQKNSNETSECCDDEQNQFKMNPKMQLKSSSAAVLDYYSVQEVLGNGGFGTVCKVTHKVLNEVRVMKMISKQKLNSKKEGLMFEQLQILREIDHPNLAKVFEHFQNEKYHFLITEYSEGGEIFERVLEQFPYSEKVASRYMKQLLGAINYCHLNSICHKDLKPENILLDTRQQNANIKIIDFGSSSKFLENQKQKLENMIYSAPEVIQNQPYSLNCDIWSLGVILYILLCGYPPFQADNCTELQDKIKSGVFSYPDPHWQNISKDVKNLIQEMLKIEPNDRITASEAHAHPWIQQNFQIEQLNDKMMKNLINFQYKNKIKIEILDLINIFYLVKGEIKNKSSGPQLSKEAIQENFHLIFNDLLKANEIIDQSIGIIQTDKNGKYDYKQFVGVVLVQQLTIFKEKINKLFKKIYQEEQQHPSQSDVEGIMKTLNVNDRIWKKVMTECKKNDGQKIDVSEFIDLLSSNVDADIFNSNQ